MHVKMHSLSYKKEEHMSNYLYIYNYTPEEKELCEMEFYTIFHQKMTSKYIVSTIDFDYRRSVFIRGKLDILKSASCFDEIVKFVEKENYVYEQFKVIYLKNEITHVSYQESIEKCKQIALPILGSVSMQNPLLELAITKIHDIWYFGIYHHESIWNKHENKPHSYSHSISLRLARTLVNIGVGNDLSLSVVDPCCGVGTVVLEAIAMGLSIKGYDINRYVSYQARLNLEHYGYDPLIVEKKDMRQLEKKFDVAIMDIPYGVYTPFDYKQRLELVQSVKHIASRLVLVTHENINEELKQMGYHIENQCILMKGTFERYITLCEIEIEGD